VGNKEIVRRFVDEYQTGCSEAAFAELLDPDVVDHSRPPGIAPGAEGVRQQFEGFRAMLDGFRAEILDQIAEGDKVVTYKNFHGTADGGHSVVIPVIDIVRVAGGRIVEHWNVVDRSALMAPSVAAATT
jgi:predicted SnoaL-like aldol condensation-catalyzing enzyme